MSKKASLMNLARPAAVESFIKSGDVPPAIVATQTPAESPRVEVVEPPAQEPAVEVVAPKPVRTRKPVNEFGGGEKKTSFTLDRDLHRQLKVLAIQKDRKLQDLFNEAVQSYLKRHTAA